MTRSATPVLSEDCSSEAVVLPKSKMSVGTDLCAESTMDNSSLISPTEPLSSVQSQLDRRTKECETAKKLIDTMRIHRERDQATIVDLNGQISALTCDGTEWKADSAKLHEQLSLLRDDLKRKKDEVATVTKKLDQLEEASALTIGQLKAEKLALADELAKFQAIQAGELAKRDRAISEVQNCVSSREVQLGLVKKECEILQQRLANTTSELDSVRTRSQADNIRLQSEIQTLTNSLGKALEESGTIRWQLENEKELELKKATEATHKLLASINFLKSDLKDREDLNQQLNIQLADMKVKHSDTKKDVQIVKSDAARRISAIGAQQSRLEIQVLNLQKDLEVAKRNERDLQDEIETLSLQQSSAIEKVAVASKAKDQTQLVANDKIQALTEKLASMEKTHKDFKLKSDSMKSEIAKSNSSRRRLEASLVDAKKNSVRMSIVSALIVLIIAKLFLV